MSDFMIRQFEPNVTLGNFAQEVSRSSTESIMSQACSRNARLVDTIDASHRGGLLGDRRSLDSRPRKLAFRSGKNAGGAILVLEGGDLFELRRVLGPVLVLRVVEGDVRDLSRLILQVLWSDELPNRVSRSKGEIGSPGVDGVDRPTWWYPLPDRSSPGSLAQTVVPLRNIVSPVRQFPH